MKTHLIKRALRIIFVALQFLAFSAVANPINGTIDSFNMRGEEDQGCYKSSDNVQTNCDSCQNDLGMAVWSVSEPYLNIWVRDEPVSYATSLGEHIGFELIHKQRDASTTGHQLVPPTGWQHNWFSYVHFRDPTTNQFATWDATLHSRSGGESQFSTVVPQNVSSGLRLQPMGGEFSYVYPSGTHPNLYGMVGCRLLYPDGSQDVYGTLTGTYWEGTPFLIPTGTNFIRLYGTNYYNCFDAVLTEHIDQYGNSIHFNYTVSSGYFRLSTVVDYDGNTTTLVYTNTGPFTGTNLLTRVDMPYGRSAVMLYDTNDFRLLSIRDAQGNSSSFTYTGTPSEIQTLTTPYGTTAFTSTAVDYMRDSIDVGNAAWTNVINRSLKIDLPGGLTELYIYRYTSQEVGVPGFLERYPSEPSPNAYDAGAPDGEGSDYLGYAYYRNTFHWNSQQYAAAVALTPDFNNWSTNHYALASMKHWLVETNQAGFSTDGFYAGRYKLSSAVSWIRQASPTGDPNSPRHVIWYDYTAKEPNKNWSIPPGAERDVVAEALDDGTTRYQQLDHDQTTSLPQTFTSTYTTPSGSVSTRTTQLSRAYAVADQTCYASWINNTTTNVVGDSSWEIPLLTSVHGPDGTALLILSGTVSTTTTTSRTTSNGTNYVFVTTYPHRLQTDITDAADNTSSVFYNSREQVLGINLANGLCISNIYDGNGFLKRSTNYAIGLSPIGINYYTFAEGLLASRTNELGLSSKYTWDKLQRLTSIAFPTDSTQYITNIYSSLDLVEQFDRLGHCATASYDSLDRLQTITDKRNKSTILSYCTCGGLRSITDPVGGSNTFWRDFNGRITNIEFTVGGSRTLTLDSVGQVTNIWDSAGVSIDLQYNNQGLLTLATTTNGTLFGASYDEYDRPTSITTAEGVTINNTEFDGLNRVKTRTFPNAGVEHYSYNAAGLSTYSDTQNHTTQLFYDPAGRLYSVKNANQDATGFGYDPAGNITSLTNALGKKTFWAYDSFGRCIYETNDNNSLVISNAYDLSGNLTRRWTKAKQLTTFVPDENGNIVTINYPTYSVNYTYDELNRIKTISEPIGATVFTYTNFGGFYGALASEDGPWASDTVTNNYFNRLLKSLTVIQPSGSWSETFVPDNQLRLRSITTPDGTFTNGYYGAGRLIQRTGLPHGNYIDNTYTSGLIQDTWLKSAAGVTLNHHGYIYDPGYYRTNATRTDATSHIVYAYDDIGQLVKATAYDATQTGTPRLNEAFGYGYDSAGNLISRTNGVLRQTFTPDNLNELASITRGTSMTVAGSLNLAPQVGSVAVNGVGASVYNDLTFATTSGVGLVNGNNTFVTTLRNSAGKTMTNAPTLNLPSSVSLYYDYDGNLTNDGLRYFEYDAADRLTAVTVSNAWRSEYTYDGLWRKRVLKQYGWREMDPIIRTRT